MDQKKIADQQKDELPAEHQGMPAVAPQAQSPQVGTPKTERDKSAEMSLSLPHERDQSTSMTPSGQSPVIRQAFEDKERGLKDTSKQPEMHDAYEKQKTKPV